MISNFLLDILFPKNCLGCNAENYYICPDCLKQIALNDYPSCYLCAKRSPGHATCPDCRYKTHLDGIIVANKWENELFKKLIYEYKYRFVKEIGKELSKTLINYLNNKESTLINIDKYKSFSSVPQNDIIFTFVPLHPRREYWRGFNQSAFLAKELNNYFNWPMVNLLKRIKNTLPQAEIKKQSARTQNIANAFKLIDENLSLKNKIIIIVDDVCTTGATLEQCAKTIKSLQPKEIWGLVLARG
jgi:ComF family protein